MQQKLQHDLFSYEPGAKSEILSNPLSQNMVAYTLQHHSNDRLEKMTVMKKALSPLTPYCCDSCLVLPKTCTNYELILLQQKADIKTHQKMVCIYIVFMVVYHL